MGHRGFTLIEAVVSISLFSLMILGATLQLRAYEDGQRSIADALVLVKTARTFMTELSQVSRQTDSFNTVATASGIQRPSASVLDGFDGTVTYGASSSQPGYDFLTDASDAPLNAELADFIARWNTEDADGRTRLFRSVGRRAKAWRVEIDGPASGAYRIIKLHLDKDNNETNLQWPICCE
jgi:prepilin-type N-terminal cleavage/methylation domain-containing protein